MDDWTLITPRLNLAAIEASLKNFQQEFCRVNAELEAEKDCFCDDILTNMLAGYAYVDTLVAARIDLFGLGHSDKILELNHIVLYGTDARRRSRHREPLTVNEKRFYQQREGGIGDLMETYQMHHKKSVWNRAALVYIHILSQPQLFVEGNHRTGALLMSYLLVREGRPPFVLTGDNAKTYFDPSSLIGKSKRHSVSMFFRMPKLKNHFARLLKEQANPDYLL